MNVRRILLIVVVLVVVGGGVFFAYQQTQQAAQPTPTIDPDSLAVDTGVDVVSAEGVIVPRRHAELSFQANGRVAEVLVQEGESVAAGDPILRLDDQEQQLRAQEAAAALTQAQAELAAAEVQLETAEAQAHSAELAVAAAEAQLALVQSAPLPQEIAAAEAQVDAAAAGIGQAAGNRDSQLEVDESEIRSAEARVAAAMAERDQIQARYDDLIENEILGAPEEETRLQLQAAQAEVEAAQAALDALVEGPTPARQRASNAAVAIAAAQRNTAQAQLDLLAAGPKPERIREAEVQVEQAEVELARAETARIEAEAAVSQAESNVTQAEAALVAAQNALERMTLTAPFAGTVADIRIDVGETATPGAPVVTLADFSEWLVETTDLTELSIVSVARGYPVEISVDALPDETLRGTVTDISAVSTLIRGDVTYEVTIRLDDEQARELPLRWGMTVFVDVDVTQAE